MPARSEKRSPASAPRAYSSRYPTAARSSAQCQPTKPELPIRSAPSSSPLPPNASSPAWTAATSKHSTQLLGDYAAAAAGGDYAAMIPIDMRFHGYLFANSGNPTLAVIWPQLEATIRKFIVVAGPQYDRDLAELVRKHERLLECIRRRDVKTVTRLLASHGQDLWRHLEHNHDAPESRRRNSMSRDRATARG